MPEVTIKHNVHKVIRTSAGSQGPPGPAGPQGPQGADGIGTPYVHEQVAPAATWTITHNLGRTPAVTLIIDGMMAFTDVEFPDDNSVTLTFAVPTSGKVSLL